MFDFTFNGIFILITSSITYKIILKILHIKTEKLKEIIKDDNKKKNALISLILYFNILIWITLLTFMFEKYTFI